MMIKIHFKKLARLASVFAVAAAISVPSFAAEVSLVADSSSVTMPDGVSIDMWGYFEDTGQACGAEPVWSGGPQLYLPAGDTTLTIHLRNCLPVETSVVITGQMLPGAPVIFPAGGPYQGRIRSFAPETAANGGTGDYTFNNLKHGTYLYKSGTHQALQVQMGLYGALIADAGPNEAYPGVSYDSDAVMLYSEIDPDLHAPPTTARPLNYKPKYFLVNGTPFVAGRTMEIGAVQQRTLLRLLNAGLKDHTAALNSGHLTVVAEDGNAYPYPLQLTSLDLVAGKTMDAVLVAQEGENYVLYDRALHLTTNGTTRGGLMMPLVAAVSGGPIANAGADQTGAAVGELIQLDGSASTGAVNYAWTIDALPLGSLATLSDPSLPNPTFTVDQSGTYAFQLIVNDGTTDSSPDLVQVVAVNMPPLADAGPDQTVSVGSPVVLDGSLSSDPDNYPAPLVYSWTLGVPLGSSATLSGETTVTPGFTADIAGVYVATLSVDDGEVISSDSVAVTVESAGPVNAAPVAYDDVATTTRNTSVSIPVLANDSDADGNDTIDIASILITTNPTQGGTAVANADGTVTFSPRRGFRGTDVFTYQVSDLQGASSNEATVRVNVVK